MTQDEIIEMARKVGYPFAEYEGKPYVPPMLAILIKTATEAEREACLALHDHEDVLAPIGASAWGEAHQAGWAEGTAAYWKAIRARGQA